MIAHCIVFLIMLCRVLSLRRDPETAWGAEEIEKARVPPCLPPGPLHSISFLMLGWVVNEGSTWNKRFQCRKAKTATGAPEMVDSMSRS